MPQLPGETLADYDLRLQQEDAARTAPKPQRIQDLPADERAAFRAAVLAEAEAASRRLPPPPVWNGKRMADCTPAERAAAYEHLGVRLPRTTWR